MFVSINMAVSMDGKIATKSRGPVKLGSAYDSRRMAEIRADHDVVINGASTFKAYPVPLHVEGEDLIANRKKQGKPSQPISAVVSSRLDIPSGTPWEKAKDSERWIFCGKNAPKAKVKRLELLGVKVIQSRAERPSPAEILKHFSNAGHKRVLVEGGGEFNAAFLEASLVDRIHLTLVPILVGGAESPSFVEGKGFPKGKFPRFRLAECREVEGELYLIYERP
jgi:5-amino-6-(5-phosphoribosylamino)uracil reductase